MKKLAIIYSLIVCFIACKHQRGSLSSVPNHFSDDVRIRIHTFGDERNADSLAIFLSAENPEYRKLASLAFASFGDKINFEKLIALLSDSVEDVRLATAYTLGQMRNTVALDSMMAAHFREKSSVVRAQLTESIGRQIIPTTPGSAFTEEQKNLNTKIYRFLLAQKPEAGVETEGWARGMMWINRAEMFDAAWCDRMWNVFAQSTGDGRVMCAIAMSRSRTAQLPGGFMLVKETAAIESDIVVKAALVLVMGKMDNSRSRDVLLAHALDNTNDQSVRIAALRGLARQKNVSANDLLRLLEDENEQLVAEVLAVLSKLDCKEVFAFVIEKCIGRSPQVAANALAIALKYDEENAATQLALAIQNSQRTIDKTFFIRAFGSAANFGAIRENVYPFFDAGNEPALMAAAADAIAAYATETKSGAQFHHLIKRIFSTGDAGAMAVMATMLCDTGTNLKGEFNETDFLRSALVKLPLPKEIETYNEIVKAINCLDGDSIQPAAASFNHPIDWEYVKTIDRNQRVDIATTKGNIIVELNVEEAPGSVSNFLKLAEEKFFDGKIFHRVVPNFVIQAGCPRGDGWGSTDYTIRSEFALHNYKAGAVGMASAGPDTESCQWFITHLPTPHLEGRYTIFGFVVEGMDVVNQTGVGDEILKVEILSR